MTIKLKELLEKKSITQAELARCTHIRPSTVCNMYNNNCTFVKLEYLKRICDVLSCKIDDLIKL